ncbi:CLUMA_CG017879, isoform A [Clunio marinus]|uniref:CLUMA_CG017879, isoform A n=1 Tax=Clunio marinus TaxID=568069 RepID=A0A1J1IYQ4_9DIPT|nr:CLUMA_CG017879, isoform A [Clunio marinus]
MALFLILFRNSFVFPLCSVCGLEQKSVAEQSPGMEKHSINLLLVNEIFIKVKNRVGIYFNSNLLSDVCVKMSIRQTMTMNGSKHQKFVSYLIMKKHDN